MRTSLTIIFFILLLAGIDSRGGTKRNPFERYHKEIAGSWERLCHTEDARARKRFKEKLRSARSALARAAHEMGGPLRAEQGRLSSKLTKTHNEERKEYLQSELSEVQKKLRQIGRWARGIEIPRGFAGSRSHGDRIAVVSRSDKANTVQILYYREMDRMTPIHEVGITESALERIRIRSGFVKKAAGGYELVSGGAALQIASNSDPDEKLLRSTGKMIDLVYIGDGRRIEMVIDAFILD